MEIEGKIKLTEDGTLIISIPSGQGIDRVLVQGDDHYGDVFYPDDEF